MAVAPSKFRKPRLPTSIPTPEDNQLSILATLNALKQAVEFLQGQIASNPGAARVFIQNEPPTAHTKGDAWFAVLPTSSLSYWDGTKWQLFAIAHPDGSLHTS